MVGTVEKCPPSFKRHLLFWNVIAGIIFIDQVAKAIIRSFLNEGEQITLIPKFFYLIFLKNTGAGFSLLEGKTGFLIVFSLIIIGIILYHYKKILQQWDLLIPFALILGGAFGNLIDRTIMGYVTDFLDFYILFDHFPPFNIADSMITIGAVILIYASFRKDIKVKQDKQKGKVK